MSATIRNRWSRDRRRALAPTGTTEASRGPIRAATWRVFFAVGSLVCVPAQISRAAPPAPAPRHVSIAAAANLVYAVEALQVAFQERRAPVQVDVTIGASGSLVAQIRHGAPFDVLLSADLEYPRALIAAGDGEPGTLQTFATGRLVLWTMDASLPLEPIAAAVDSTRVRKIALAQPETAPYGRAAREALQRLGVWSHAQPKLVVGENVTQTAQFVETGNAEIGFVALSLVLSPRLRERGRWLEVPAALHAPLLHGAVLTRRGARNPAAAEFLDFLRSVPARAVLQRYGYAVPP